jgi:hypothetical protein
LIGEGLRGEDSTVAVQTFKVLIFLKRRPGMSLEAFRDYYEGVHSKLCEGYSRGARRYVRRYVQPRPNSLTGKDDELEFDVITELWFEDRAVFEKAVYHASRGELPAAVLADEERLFDRSKTRYATVVEFGSELPARDGG